AFDFFRSLLGVTLAVVRPWSIALIAAWQPRYCSDRTHLEQYMRELQPLLHSATSSWATRCRVRTNVVHSDRSGFVGSADDACAMSLREAPDIAPCRHRPAAHRRGLDQWSAGKDAPRHRRSTDNAYSRAGRETRSDASSLQQGRS